MAKRKTEKDYYELAKFRGFEWVGEELPKTVLTKTLWKCGKGHTWYTKYNNIYNHRGCPICSNRIKKVEEDYHILAKRQGLKWSGKTLPKDTHSKTLWECKEGHIWLAQYNSIDGRSGCPCCSNKVKKVKKDYYTLAKFREFKWVGSELPKNIQSKTLWECKKGHQWLARYADTSRGEGCPYCANTTKKVKEDYYTIAEHRGFIWAGKTLPKNIKTKTLWECKRKHQWLATYNNVSRGTNCPYCDDRINGCKVSKPQRGLNEMLQGSLNYPEDRYRIDVAIMRNSQKIAVEYDAQYWHEGKEEHDKERGIFLISCGWKVLHVKSGELLPTRKQLKKAINKLLNGEDLVNIFLEDWKTAQ